MFFSDFVFRIFNRLGVFGVVFEGLWDSLGRLVPPVWGLIGLSWVCLGGSGSPFGGSWALCGGHLVLLGVCWWCFVEIDRTFVSRFRAMPHCIVGRVCSL